MTDQAGTSSTERRLADDVDHARLQLADLQREYEELLADPGVIQEDRDTTRVLLEQARDTCGAAERSLQRFHDGSYGTCGRCGGVIGAERLQALPDADTCVACAGK